MAMQKSAVLRGGNDQHADSRAYLMHQLRQSSLDVVIRFLYPLLLDIADMDAQVSLSFPLFHQAGTFLDDAEAAEAADSSERQLFGPRNLVLPRILRLTLSTLSATGIYLLDEGVALWLLVGDQVPVQTMRDVFGVDSLQGYDVAMMDLPQLETSLSKRLWNIVSELRADRLYFCPLEVVRSGDVDFAKLKWRMVEDRDVFPGANYSYSEYVQLLTGGNPGY